METKSLSRQRDFSYYINSYTNLKANEASGPLVIERGDGVFVYDEDGKEYLEGMSGLWCVSLGFSESRLIQAAEQQMKPCPITTVSPARFPRSPLNYRNGWSKWLPNR